jgi:hypothetical protein
MNYELLKYSITHAITLLRGELADSTERAKHDFRYVL